MDPDALWKRIIEEAEQTLQGSQADEGVELSIMILDLHEWLKKGGALPKAWQR